MHRCDSRFVGLIILLCIVCKNMWGYIEFKYINLSKKVRLQNLRAISTSAYILHYILVAWLYKAAITWDILRSWTGIDLDKLVGSKINTPENAILMCRDQHLDFGRYKWYLDKDAVCCLLDSSFLTK